MFNNRYARRNSPDWRVMREELKLAKKTFIEKGHMMDEFTKHEFKEELEERRRLYYSPIQNGTIGEFKASIEKVKEARRKIDQAKGKEINRFDMGRLAGEMQALQILVDMEIKQPRLLGGGDPSVLVGLERIYKEAKLSGDLHKQRAAFEVLRGLKEKTSPGTFQENIRWDINHLASQAERELAELRTIPEMAAAQEEENQAENELLAHYNELEQSHLALYDSPLDSGLPSNPFEHAARMVQRDHDTGELVFYDEKDPEVTRVYHNVKNEVHIAE